MSQGKPTRLPNSQQPRKTFYILYSLALLVVKLPYYIVESALWPPMRSWSFKKAINVRMLKWFISINNQMGEMIPPYNHLKVILNPRKDVLGIWIDPVDDKYIPRDVKAFAEQASVQSTRIPGYWYYQKGQPLLGEQKAAPGEEVVCYIHGGGFIHQSAHPADLVAGSAIGTLRALPHLRRLLSIEYRLTTGEPVAPAANPFPAALLDVLSGYSYLVNVLKFAPKNIIVAGDSCGANLALALLRSIRELQNPDFGMPKAAILYSPWADPGDSHHTENSSVANFGHIDYAASYVQNMWAIQVYTAPFGKGFYAANPYVSPASKVLPSQVQQGIFKGFPKTIIFGGEYEQLIDSIRTLRDKMETDMGKDAVTYMENKDGVHDIAPLLWFEPERGQMLRKVTEWYSTLK